MKFIVDGDGYVSRSAARALLTDIAKPYTDVTFVTPFLPVGPEYKSTIHQVEEVLDLMANAGLCKHAHSLGILEELQVPGEKVLITVGNPYNRMDQAVRYCYEHDIPVLDLEKGLYPVR